MKLTITGSKWEIEQWILTTARGLNAGQPLTAGTEYKRPQKPLSEYVRDYALLRGITEYNVLHGHTIANFNTLAEAREYARAQDEEAYIVAWTYFSDGTRVHEEETPEGVKRCDEDRDETYREIFQQMEDEGRIPFLSGLSHKTYAFAEV